MRGAHFVVWCGQEGARGAEIVGDRNKLRQGYDLVLEACVHEAFGDLKSESESETISDVGLNQKNRVMLFEVSPSTIALQSLRLRKFSMQMEANLTKNEVTAARRAGLRGFKI